MGKILIIIAIAIVAVILGPLATLWSLNILFPALAIPYTFDTWLAAFVLSAVVSGQGLSFSNKK